MHKVIATRTISQTNFREPLHNRVIAQIIEEVLVKTSDGYMVYDNCRSVHGDGIAYNRQISDLRPAPAELVKEYGDVQG